MGIFIAYLLGVLSSVGRKNSNSNNVQTHADRSDRQTLPDGPTSVMCIPPTPTNEERAEQKKSKRRKAIKFWAEIVGLIVLTIYTVYTASTYYQIKESAEAATKQFRADQRAWLAIAFLSGTPKAGQDLPVTIQTVNHGKTTAINVHTCAVADAVAASQEFPGFRDYTATDCTAEDIITPVGSAYLHAKVISTVHNTRIDKAIADRLTDGRIVVRIYGKTTYSDIFGCHRWISFCVRREATVQGVIDWIGCRTGNAIDTEPKCTK